MNKQNNSVLEVDNLKTYFHLEEGILKAVDGVSFKVKKEKTLGIVGESGCGKSVTASSILRLVPKPGKIEDGKIIIKTKYHQNIDMIKLDPKGKEIKKIRWSNIAIIFQEPMSSFFPVHTIGQQIVEAILLHSDKTRKEARNITLDLLQKVGISNPSQRFDEYPYQFSGGMRQRAMIAMALACNPILLIADEPTTALDVTVQAQVLDLMTDLQTEYGMSIIYITHDLGVIAEMADEVAVMYLGKIVEYANVKDLFHNSLHPYTEALLKSIPRGIASKEKKNIRLEVINGTVPTPINLLDRCVFYSRCKQAKKGLCNKGTPSLDEVEKNHKVSCFLYN